MKRLDDSKLIARIRQGDKALFGILTEKYYDSIYYYCYYKIGQEAAAYDCTQDTFLKLIRFFDAYEDRNKFKSYLFSIATNVCNDYFRKNPNIFVTEKYLEAIPILDIKLQASENKYSIQNALNKLPDFQKEVIILRFYYDFKIKDIANIVGITMSAAKSRLKQGLDKLKKLLKEEDFFEN